MRCLFFFNDTATTEIYTLSLHDALPISGRTDMRSATPRQSSSPVSTIVCTTTDSACSSPSIPGRALAHSVSLSSTRSEEHTSELQSRQYLVCRLLLEKTKQDRAYALLYI